ncbi:helix-turn-helix domain-containing protein [Pedobacter lithocola]|uniref:Helix-turn-helix domain-containing protein n=2 Tax=Pedobacter lithocola TaxID=1908239 RepID=A0ABV8P5W0_9SPHI
MITLESLNLFFLLSYLIIVMTEEELLKKIGQRIKELRREKGMPQIELAVELNYEKSNMSRLESGRVNPRITTLFKVAKALDVDLQELINITK